MGDINLVEIPIYIINFLVTFLLLYILLYKPVSKFLGARHDRIANSLAEAEATQNEAEGILREAKDELASTGEKARKLSQEAIENAAFDAERIVDDAEEKASAMIVRAREQMEAERQAAMERAYTELVSFAGILASRILSREITIEDNREIAERFFSEQVPQDKGAVALKEEKKS